MFKVGDKIRAEMGVHQGAKEYTEQQREIIKSEPFHTILREASEKDKKVADAIDRAFAAKKNLRYTPQYQTLKEHI